MPTEVQIYKDGTVVADDLADKTITAAQLADKTITAAQIADTTITAAKLSTGGPNWDTAGNLTASSFKTSTASTGFLKADGTVDTNTYITQAVPVGSVFHFAASTAPTGYLKANGNTVPNGPGTVQGITADFSALYAILGSTYGAAGKLPDLRGEFIRGWADDRTDLGTQVGFGKTQDWAIQNITGSFQSSGGFSAGSLTGGTGVFSISDPLYGKVLAGSDQPYTFNRTLNMNASSQVKTSTETRPRNVALLACIKY